METVVGVEGNDDVKFEDCVAVKTGPASSSAKHIADPVVYKLVRVEGDGSLVPATDDEVMEVEEMLEDGKIETSYIADTDHTAGCSSNHIVSCTSAISELKDSEGLLKLQNLEVDAKKSNEQLEAVIDSGKVNCQPEEIVPSLPSPNDRLLDLSASIRQCSKSLADLIEGGLSTSAVISSMKPDFSKLQGEICLDNMSVKELQETFKATFGRETSVKDKQWLKRRIAMGLLHTCDVTTTTFFIKDNKVVPMCKEESCKRFDSTLAEDPADREMNEVSKSSTVHLNNPVGDSVLVSAERLENSSLEYSNEDLQMEQRAAKRVRKPTRRYIEELSEIESRGSCGKFMSSMKNSGYGQPSGETHFRPVQTVHSDGRPFVTRQDSLGGCGVKVPYVSRVRRGRPRENFMALMKLHSSSLGMAARLVKKALAVHDPQPHDGRVNKVIKAQLGPRWIQRPLIAEPQKDKQYLERERTELKKDLDLRHLGSCGDNSEGNIVTVPTAKGGMRRKHHRPWTLNEVVKLIEGVARYGAGRWSEIKRLAFSSYSYRTSVDLKDKWRNLLRASFAQLPGEEGVQNSRKHGAMPIPAAILSRVRELAETQKQVPSNLSSIKFAGLGGRGVNETRSGFL